MKKTISILTLTTLVLSFFAIAPASTVTVVTPPLMERLRGQQINLNMGDTLFFTNDATNVWHGFYTGPPPEWPLWREMSGRQKSEYMCTTSFKLFIDNEEVRLRRYQWYDRQEDVMYVLFWIEFSPNTFPPDQYVFRGEWYFEFNGDSYSQTSQITVTVTSPP